MNPALQFLYIMKQRLADWIVLVVLMVLFIILEVFVPPYVRYIPEGQVDSLHYPLKPNSIPSWVVPVIGILLPLLVFTIYQLVWKCEIREYHDLILGSLMNIMVTACLTSALKESIGRPRPDFFARCFPDGVAKFDASGNWMCDPSVASIVREGRKSFPSAHSSWSMSSLAYISFFLMGKMQVFSGTTQFWKFIVSWVPIVGAVAVGVTRINDYWHHWSDVVVGLILGIAVAFIFYVQNYKNPFARAETQVPLHQLLAQFGRTAFGLGPLVEEPYMSLESGPAGGHHRQKNIPESSEGEPFLDP